MPKITNAAKLNEVPLRNLIPGLEGSGMTLHGKCPKCGAEGKKKSKWQGLWVKDDDLHNKHMCGCNSCKISFGGGAINVLMGLYDLEFVAACERISHDAGIELEFEQPTRKSSAKSPVKIKGSFCAKQLEESGLTPQDVMATVSDGDDVLTVCPFRPGSLNVYSGEIDEKGPDMLILYYDLEGRRRGCIPSKNRSREVGYTRVRWSLPELHTDRLGKAIKYQTIAGAKSELYIPQKIRSLYSSYSKFETLFIQEGEKKSEKACKHGIPSIAIQGINNIGRKDEGLPHEIQQLVQRCEIKNLVLLMDSDWEDLSRNLVDDASVDARPKDFSGAVIKFKKFVQTLALSGIHVDIWFAHVNKLDSAEKGIDDLLCGSLKGKEQELREDIDSAMIAHDGSGKFVDCINVTSWSDSKIRSLWCLDTADDFFEAHRERLEKLRSFRFGGVFYKVEDGKFKVATEVGTGKDFWTVSYDDKGKEKIEIDLIYLKDFLITNGFRCRKLDNGLRDFVKIDSGVIRTVDVFDIRNFVLNYVNRATKSHKIRLFFAENIVSKLSEANLCQLDQLVTTAGQRMQSLQKFYFLDSEVEISSKAIGASALVGPVYEENLVKRKFERIKIFKQFEPDGYGSFNILTTDAGDECEFFRFLCNVSNIFKGAAMTPKSNAEHRLHIANKISCIGYLLRDWKNPNEKRAVVAMDAKMSEVGKSTGRTGKSFIGEAIGKFVSQAYIGARNPENIGSYMYSDVTRQTVNIVIDDIPSNFNFGKFFTDITGNLNVNVKQGHKFTIDFDKAPKFYITTNHALENLDDSSRARLIFMSFSDWYSVNFSPMDEFGHFFFEGWDDRQWLLFDNLMLECVMIYMRSLENNWGEMGKGAIAPPMEGIHLRELRQEMGEQFLSWAEVYFSEETGNIGRRIVRKELYETYLNEFGIKPTQSTAKTFRDKIFAFCKFAGFHFNAHRRNKDGWSFADWIEANPNEIFFGDRDTSCSTEYYTLTK